MSHHTKFHFMTDTLHVDGYEEERLNKYIYRKAECDAEITTCVCECNAARDDSSANRDAIFDAMRFSSVHVTIGITSKRSVANDAERAAVFSCGRLSSGIEKKSATRRKTCHKL